MDLSSDSSGCTMKRKRPDLSSDGESRPMKPLSPVIGIDLGTTYSRVGVWREGRVEIIPNEHGYRNTPSCVAFTDKGRLIGDATVDQASTNPTNTIFDIKRLIGRRFDDYTVQCDIEQWPFKVSSDSEDKPKIIVEYKGEEKQFVAEEISSMVLAKMKEIAEVYLGTTVKNAVISVPASFNALQRQATKDAGLIAGLNVMRLINEPTATAIAYGLDKNRTIVGEKNIVVFDLGGGTFDVSLIAIEEDFLAVRATDGDTHLGGVDFDNRMVDYFIREFKKKHNKDISVNPKAVRRLKTASERAKRVLSTSTDARIELDSLDDGIDFYTTITLAEFNKLNVDLFEKCIKCMEKCLAYAGFSERSIYDVVVVGGSTRIPKIQHMLQDFFYKKALCKSLNPEESVAFGAAVQAAILSGDCDDEEIRDLELVDVAPLSVGINSGGAMDQVMIPRNIAIPVTVGGNFTTFFDNQTAVIIKVTEGGRTMAIDGNVIGEFEVCDIPCAPRGAVDIRVLFAIDQDGIFTLSANDASTRQKKKIVVVDSMGRLSEKEMKRMACEAAKYKAEDEAEMKRVEAWNALESFVYDMDRAVKDDKVRPKVAVAHKKRRADAINRAFRWLERNRMADTCDIEDRMNDLKDALFWFRQPA